MRETGICSPQLFGLIRCVEAKKYKLRVLKIGYQT
jgi:hypothetical protein